MTGRAAAIQGGLAALGLIAAHLTWQREPEHAPGEVSILDAGKNDVGRVHYEDEATAIDLDRGKPGSDQPVWIHLVEKIPPRILPPKGSPKNAPLPSAAAPNPPRDLRGSEAAEKLLDQFAPLRSPRAFGVLDAAKLKELGLDNSKRKLVVTVKGDTHEYTVGQAASSGGGETFLRDNRDGRVYLMPHGMVGDLKSGSGRLVDRKMHTFDQSEFDKIVVAAGGKKRELVQTHRENIHATQLASPKTADKPDQMAKNWHELLWRSVPIEVLGKGEQPKDGAPEVVARVDYFDGKKPLGWVEIAKGTAAAPQESSSAPSGNPPDLYVRTERTAGWVKVRAGAQLLTDAEKVAAAP